MAASTCRRSGGGHQKPAAFPAYMARYEPLERLGAGKNGEVFKSWDKQEKRIVAVKRLSGTGTAGGDRLFFSGLPGVARETRYLRACHDIPSVVKLLDKPFVPAVQTDDSFIVMDYVGRLNLRTYMQRRARRHRRFSEAEVRRIMKQLLEAIMPVHGKGIIHLDISPENVILDDGTEDRTQRPKLKAIHRQGVNVAARGKKLKVKEEGIVYKIGGFGMSRMKERPDVIISTPYSAPELLLHSCEYDERVDTWGLGCIMADLLSGTGRPTFGRDGDPDEIMSRVSRIVGMQGIKDWPGYSGIAAEWKSKLPAKKNKSKLAGIAAGFKSKLLGEDRLRRRFPWWRLSSAGFEVLSGLLESNPAKRLTAAEALQKSWFQERE